MTSVSSAMSTRPVRPCSVSVGCGLPRVGDAQGNVDGVRAGNEILAGEDVVAEDEIVEADEQDAEPAKVLPTPVLPSPSEVEEHRVDHIPYRCWCRECVEGFGREEGHFSRDGERGLPIISLDDMLLCRRGVFERKEFVPVEAELVLKILIVRDSRSSTPRSPIASTLRCLRSCQMCTRTKHGLLNQCHLR